jgi:hypothetical protein|tara:strand:- start:37 stop:207 length:171 start_codon:yes stop_codon:yes gene_type:complete
MIDFIRDNPALVYYAGVIGMFLFVCVVSKIVQKILEKAEKVLDVSLVAHNPFVRLG